MVTLGAELYLKSMDLDIPSAECLLDSRGAIPVAREIETTGMSPDSNPDRIAAAGLASIRHCDLERRVTIDTDRVKRISDVLETRLTVEGCRVRQSGRMRCQRCH